MASLFNATAQLCFTTWHVRYPESIQEPIHYLHPYRCTFISFGTSTGNYHHLVTTSSLEVTAYARVIDFGWKLCRLSIDETLFSLADSQCQVIPAWTGFNMLLCEDSFPRECSIGYCQVIEASPTKLPTIYSVLQRSLQMGDQLGQHDVIVVFDQAIYAKALEVLWQNLEQFQRLVVRIGSFHTICAFLAAIGKRFGDGGLSDVITESGIVGSGSVAGVLEGRHYNRAVHTHKVQKPG